MRINSAVDIRYEALVFSAIAFMTAGLILTMSMGFSLQEIAMCCTIVIIAAAFLIWYLFSAYYELRREFVYCKCGPFSEKIRYDDIFSLALSRNSSTSMALSSNRIKILYYSDGFIAQTMISPKNREDFLVHLKARCKYLVSET